jgi:HAD superfamily hydrolase (TIGR01509 family)
MNPLELETFDALIFDLDGTLADSMSLHNQAWIDTLSTFGCQMTAQILNEYAGIPNPETVRLFNERFDWKLDPIQVAELKEVTFLKKVHLIRPIEPVLDIVRKHDQKKPMAIVTGGNRPLVKVIVETLKIERFFETIVCAEDAPRAKPYPDPFLLAARRLDVRPERCIVFEDGNAGIEAAKAAKMAVIKVEKSESDFRLLRQ